MNQLTPTVRGALWMLGAVFSFALMAIAVRELQRHMGSFEIVFLRSLGMLAITLAMLPRAGVATIRTTRFQLHLWRNLIHFLGQVLWVYSIGALALATVFAIEFTMPVWTAILAALFLGERLTQPRLVQLGLGLVGVLIILRPGAGSFHPAALAMILGSLCYASSFIFTKRLTSTDNALAVLFWMSVVQTPISLVAAIPDWVTPVLADAPWIAGIGAGAFTAHYCMTQAMRLVDAMVVVPIDFIRLPLIAVVGALAYGEAFDPLVIAGAAIIFAGTYYSLSRERR
ncbi:MAG TPA: DMT family transporter [Burkholderiales bacterium]|jgi:drug/metabolite transporter (DMT)-like permease|nr:DMT family transporter [Burkholderiales bacterium]